MGFRKSIKRDKYDALFSLLVRERNDWVCERCFRCFRHNPGQLHCSHLFGRRNKGVRVHPWNAFAHCAGCHKFFEENPVLFADWATEKLGQAKYDRLKLMANRPTKVTKFDKEYIHKFYLKEKKRILTLRKEGRTGRLEFLLP